MYCNHEIAFMTFVQSTLDPYKSWSFNFQHHRRHLKTRMASWYLTLNQGLQEEEDTPLILSGNKFQKVIWCTISLSLFGTDKESCTKKLFSPLDHYTLSVWIEDAEVLANTFRKNKRVFISKLLEILVV